jgi:nicotinamide-nucleotide amidase
MTGAADVLAALGRRGWTVATGESLTAGLVAAALADVPGASATLRGGVIAYQVPVKARLLAVTDDDLAHGVVSGQVARAMARGAADALGADVGIGTTGVAGPEPHDGEPVGSVWIAVTSPSGTAVRHLDLAGSRAAIRAQTVAACVDLLAAELGLGSDASRE